MKIMFKKQFDLFNKYKSKDMTLVGLLFDNKYTYFILILIFGCLYSFYLYFVPTVANFVIVAFISFIIRDIGYFRRSVAFWPTLRNILDYDKIDLALRDGKGPGNINEIQSNEITPTDCLKNKDNDGNHNSKNLTNKFFNYLGIAGFLWLFFTLIVMFKGMYYDVKISKNGIIQELHESQFNKVKDVYATVLFDDGNSCIFKLYNPGYKVGDEISVNIKQSNDYIYASEGH